MLTRILETSSTTGTMITTTNSAAISLDGAHTFSVQCGVDINTPAAVPFTADNATETFTAANHGLTTGLKTQVSNSGGALPSGLSAATDYFVIAVTANTFRLATSLANALAGTNLLIADDGTGTQTITPTAVAGATVALQKSNDGVTWAAEGVSTPITGDATFFLEKVDPSARYMRVTYTITAGSMSATHYILCKGEI